MTEKAFVKALNLLDVLGSSDEPRGITSLADELQLTKSNVHRLLMTLLRHGYVVQTEAKGSYALTTKMWEIGSNVISRLDYVRLAREQMPELAEEVGETVHLSTLDGRDVVYVDKIESAHAVRAYTRVGSRAPAWCVATGKAMLAYQPESFIDTLTPYLEKFTPHSVTDIEQLKSQLGQVRTNGYAVNRGEWREDVSGVACPIFSASGNVVAAIGISGPTARIKARHIKDHAGKVQIASQRISKGLGYLK